MTEVSSAEINLVRELPKAARRDSFLVVLVVLIAVCTSFPVGKLMLGDDASYAATASAFAHTGHVVYNGWAAPSLGWQIVWGALFIKLFGDTALSLRLSMVVLGAVAIFLWHRAILHFGAGRRFAMVLALAFALSPLYMILLSSFMTDITGFLTFAVCVVMCQRAVLARTDRSTVLWLLGACAANLVDGSVRQICWLGTLVMVPSTAWLLRKRRGVLWAGVVSLVASPVLIQIYSHWYLSHPYVAAEKYLLGPIGQAELRHFAMNWTAALFLLTVAAAPIAIAWILKFRMLSRFARLRIFAGVAVVALYLFKLAHGSVEKLAENVFPWRPPIYESCGFPEGASAFHTPAVLGLFGRSVLSILVVGALLVLVEMMCRVWRQGSHKSSDLRAMFWILVPYTLAYAAAVSGRALFSLMQDRYLLMLVPVVMLWMARLYELHFGSKVPTASVVAMVVVAVFTVAANATLFSMLRAEIRLDERWRGSGMPRSAISEGFGMDLAEQVSNGGHINDERFKDIPGGYDATVPHWDLPPDCGVIFDQWFSKIRPRYFSVGYIDSACYVKSDIPSESYRAYLPPFHREIYIAEGGSQGKQGK